MGVKKFTKTRKTLYIHIDIFNFIIIYIIPPLIIVFAFAKQINSRASLIRSANRTFELLNSLSVVDVTVLGFSTQIHSLYKVFIDSYRVSHYSKMQVIRIS